MGKLHIFVLGLTLAACASPESELRAVGSEATALESLTPDEVAALGGLLPDVIGGIPQHPGIQNKQKRELLRFTGTQWNFGQGALQLRGDGAIAPCELDGVSYDQCMYTVQEFLDAEGNVVATDPAGMVIYHPEDGTWQQSAVVRYAIRTDPTDSATELYGLTSTFCVTDYEKSDQDERQASTGVYSDCDAALQGVSAGWGDQYHQSLRTQAMDITGMVEGEYYLVHTFDPDDQWLELDELNNVSWVKFRLSRTGANPEITVLESYGVTPSSNR